MSDDKPTIIKVLLHKDFNSKKLSTLAGMPDQTIWDTFVNDQQNEMLEKALLGYREHFIPFLLIPPKIDHERLQTFFQNCQLKMTIITNGHWSSENGIHLSWPDE